MREVHASSEPIVEIGRNVAAIRFRRWPASLTCLALAAWSSAAFVVLRSDGVQVVSVYRRP